MTAEAPAGLSADFASLPSLTLDEGQLGDLELLLTGAFAPLTGFMSGADVASVAERGTLADGTPWPAPVTLDVPAEALPPDAGQALLNDPEGTPLAVLDITERLALGSAGDRPQGRGGRHAAEPAWSGSAARSPAAVRRSTARSGTCGAIQPTCGLISPTARCSATPPAARCTAGR